ncbi:MAG: FtsQ-type POTRA domain-containing protein, partial [Sphingomonadaceae bacterium]|nr:FtsQ-type POTRA domain-containing protein [Sphingomonadaceae bacterium]
AVGAAMWMVRLPQTAAWEAGEGIGRLGFAVERVEVRGLERMTEHQIHEAALAGDSLAMTNIDLTDIRARVEAIGWVRSARVSRRLPDTLVIAIEERAPVAIWQHRGALTLIDIEGEPLGPIELDAMPDLPLIVGPGANRQVAAYVALIDAAPALRPMLEGATWIGSRRWDLRFQSGEELALPEGDEAAARALVRFARMDGVTGLLGEGFNRFDMRLPDRLVVRVPRERARREAGEDPSENI